MQQPRGYYDFDFSTIGEMPQEVICRESEAHETEPRQINRNTGTLVSAVHLSTSLVAAEGSVTVTDQKETS